MLLVKDILISDEILQEVFTCDLSACKGACCVEGDLGAPLEKEECDILDREYENIAPYLSAAGRKVINKEGTHVLDFEDDYSTPTINDRECAYATYDEKGILKCGIEQAYLDGKTDFMKPVSCHLYPIRTLKYSEGEALNYDRWSICNPARSCGRKTGIRVYEFTKSALIRKYGEDWYEELCEVAEAYLNRGGADS